VLLPHEAAEVIGPHARGQRRLLHLLLLALFFEHVHAHNLLRVPGTPNNLLYIGFLSSLGAFIYAPGAQNTPRSSSILMRPAPAAPQVALDELG
jgi:hypothetical protein